MDAEGTLAGASGRVESGTETESNPCKQLPSLLSVNDGLSTFSTLYLGKSTLVQRSQTANMDRDDHLHIASACATQRKTRLDCPANFESNSIEHF